MQDRAGTHCLRTRYPTLNQLKFSSHHKESGLNLKVRYLFRSSLLDAGSSGITGPMSQGSQGICVLNMNIVPGINQVTIQAGLKFSEDGQAADRS